MRDSSSISIVAHGDQWRLSASQRVPRPPGKVFPFFASADNLERLTPAFLHFRIERKPAGSLQSGALIDYRLRLHGWPIRWRTQIQDWTPPLRFVDVQQRGPFRRWHHLHEFIADGAGTVVRDTVTYDLYCRPLSRTPALAWIEGDLRRIFEHRQDQIAAQFRRPQEENMT